MIHAFAKYESRTKRKVVSNSSCLDEDGRIDDVWGEPLVDSSTDASADDTAVLDCTVQDSPARQRDPTRRLI